MGGVRVVDHGDSYSLGLRVHHGVFAPRHPPAAPARLGYVLPVPVGVEAVYTVPYLQSCMPSPLQHLEQHDQFDTMTLRYGTKLLQAR